MTDNNSDIASQAHRKLYKTTMIITNSVYATKRCLSGITMNGSTLTSTVVV